MAQAFKPRPPATWGLAIDWETSGYSVPNYAAQHSGISFGAAIFNLQTFEAVDFLYLEVKPKEGALWDEGAERIHGLSQEHLSKHGVERTQAAAELGSMILRWIGSGNKVLALGHRVHFDIAFTDDLMAEIGVQLDWDPIKIDTAALGAVFLHETSSDGLFRACGFDDRQAHNSLEDILMTLEAVRLMKERYLRT